MAGNDVRPIIVKRKKVVGGDGHHGGAWKVAYADFVTAMMAFFMLMWLLNATTENQRKGLADYFSPTVPITRISGGGDGPHGGDSPFSEAVAAQEGTGATSLRPTEGRQSLGLSGTDHREEEDTADDPALAEIEGSLTGDGGDAIVSDLTRPHIETRLTDEGLIIEIFSRPNAPLFDPATEVAQPWLAELALVMADLFGTVTNNIAVEAHIAAEPVVRAGSGGWQRTTERAQVMRALLEVGGLDPRRIVRVTGHSDRDTATIPATAPRNDRIEIILLREAF